MTMPNIIVKAERNMETISDKAKEYILSAKADNTVKSYKSDWKDFVTYCQTNNLPYLPADIGTVMNYISEKAETNKVSTIVRRLSSINQAHEAMGLESPTKSFNVKAVVKGIKNTKGTMPDKKASAVLEDIRAMVKSLGESLIDTRDRALILIGFAGAFRRSELVSIKVEDLEFDREGLTITLRSSKTDQEGQGYKKGIPYGSNLDTCPIRSLQYWLKESQITEGHVFRSINRYGRISISAMTDHSVARIVKKLAKKAGMDEQKYSGHSLRSGLITTCANAGVDERTIMKQSGHKSITVMRGYIQDATLFQNNAVKNIGL